MLEKRPRETRRPFAPRIQRFGVFGSQNCNLELSYAHIRDEESYDSPARRYPTKFPLGAARTDAVIAELIAALTEGGNPTSRGPAVGLQADGCASLFGLCPDIPNRTAGADRSGGRAGSSMNLRRCESPGNTARIAALSTNQAPTAIIGCPL
jgi:hypothetical protein